MKRFFIIAFLLGACLPASAQQTVFGKNKVQYKDFHWFYVQSRDRKSVV